MNELCEIIGKVKSGETLSLEGRTYPIAPEDSFHLTGLHFSNTANHDENPDGERFCGIYLENKENVTIDGKGASVMIHGKMTPFIFKNCRNIVMKNITFDHFRPTMSEFTVLECEGGRAKIKINSEFLYTTEGDSLVWISENDFSGKPYWKLQYKGPKILSNRLRPDNNIVDDVISAEGDWWHGVPDISRITEISKGLLDIEFRNKDTYIAPGTVVQTRSIRRLQTGGGIDGCKNVTLDSLRIKSMNCFGIIAQNSENVTYLNLDCTPAEGRTVVSDADFFHFSGCSGRVTVSGCKAKGAHDDIINLHGTHLKIIDLDTENRRVTVRYSHPESRGFNPYTSGDSIEFVCGNTLLPYSEATVTDVEKISDSDFIITVTNVPDKTKGDNDVIENTTRTAELLVENNVFEGIPSRAILVTTRKNAVIRNNTLRNMGGPALLVADDANFWFESGRSGNICFENNRVINCGARETDKGCDIIRYEPVIMDESGSIPVHKNLIVRNNEFINDNCGEYTIRLKSLEKAEITGNKSNVKLNIVSDGITEITKDDDISR